MSRELLKKALDCLLESKFVAERFQDDKKRDNLISEIEKHFYETDNNINIITAYRFGDKENHSYVVGAFSTKDEAIRQAKKEEEWRGGKYDCEVISGRINESRKYSNYTVEYRIPKNE